MGRRSTEKATPEPTADGDALADWHKTLLIQEHYAAQEASRRFGSEVIRFCFLVNGGALIALLTFLGSAQPLSAETAEAASNVFRCFAIGLMNAGLASVGVWTFQTYWNGERLDRIVNNIDPFKHPPRTLVSQWAPRLVGICVGLSLIGAIFGFGVASDFISDLATP